MTWVERRLDLSGLLKKKSHFLFGPRQTGKSSLIRHALSETRIYDLLDNVTFLALSQNPSRMAEELRAQDSMVVIDEVQRLPLLLNEVHRLIETKNIRFLLTGSSARKLRRGGVNLLGGRARTKHLYPLTRIELGDEFNLNRAITHGLLPSIYFSDEHEEDLAAYTGTYLQQEVMAEGLTRNIPAFSRFLKVAAFCNATIVNFTNVANDAQVKRTTIYEYFDILKDTLLIHELPAWRKTTKRKPLASSKYYFFDTGVVSALQGRFFRPGTPEFGNAFETYIMHELVCYQDFTNAEPINYWRSTTGFEVDFIIGGHTAIEVKAKKNVSQQDIRSLKAIAEENNLKNYICISFEPRSRRVGQIEIMPYGEFLDKLWNGYYKA